METAKDIPTGIIILTGVISAGATVGLMRIIFGSLKERIGKVECIVKKIKLPNVGEAMCDEKTKTFKESMQNFMIEAKDSKLELKKHGEDLAGINGKLDRVLDAIKERNSHAGI